MYKYIYVRTYKGIHRKKEKSESVLFIYFSLSVTTFRIDPHSYGGVGYSWNILENFDYQDTNRVFLEPRYILSEDTKDDVNPVCPWSG